MFTTKTLGLVLGAALLAAPFAASAQEAPKVIRIAFSSAGVGGKPAAASGRDGTRTPRR